MKLGNLYATRKVDSLMHENRQFKDEINAALNKYIHNDWGDTSPEDKWVNNEALYFGDRIFSVYNTCEVLYGS